MSTRENIRLIARAPLQNSNDRSSNLVYFSIKLSTVRYFQTCQNATLLEITWKSHVAAHMYTNQNLQNSNEKLSNVIYFSIKLQTKHYRFYGIFKQLSLQVLGAKSHYCILVYTL